MTRHFICKSQDIAENGMTAFDLAGGRTVLMLKYEERIFACDNVCPHQEVRLDEGMFDDGVLTCHQHLWQWNVATGEPVGLAECPLKTYAVHMDDDSVYVDTDVDP
ncbi:Rieske 2Fe-2S domain-containing protein [Caballeronia sp. GACF5]|uniref:Rieske 2Fe-2S domain-containing protein n=1 Tax=Caballeronia sp. GACF5 TaxID=2921746 RepID=UPI0032EAF282